MLTTSTMACFQTPQEPSQLCTREASPEVEKPRPEENAFRCETLIYESQLPAARSRFSKARQLVHCGSALWRFVSKSITGNVGACKSTVRLTSSHSCLLPFSVSNLSKERGSGCNPARIVRFTTSPPSCQLTGQINNPLCSNALQE